MDGELGCDHDLDHLLSRFGVPGEFRTGGGGRAGAVRRCGAAVQRCVDTLTYLGKVAAVEKERGALKRRRESQDIVTRESWQVIVVDGEHTDLSGQWQLCE